MTRGLLAAALALTAATGTVGASAYTPPSSPRVTSSTQQAGTPTPTASASPVGPGCASIKQSLSGIADKGLGTAVAQIPELSMLSQAIKTAGWQKKLNSARHLTLFAPDNQAFQAIPAKKRDKIMADKQELTKILSYQVVQGRKTPAELKGATLKTLQGGELKVKGSGKNVTVNNAKIVCGNVPARNATVYIIDKVLMPH
ncbi:fasciclin domain-containing protein [Nonomuraea sp. NPDC049784]|uniref:fasciclin domain-containing protein n=1 Tax=Nonomuraea sp. NPDC049784 TaxID=3154361 RepID=UPI0033DC5A33